MSIDRETLMAYADGELDEVAVKRVERAMAEDPALAAEVARHRALRARLAAHFAPISEAPVPEALQATLRDSAQIVDLAAVREAKRSIEVGRRSWGWRGAGAVAAALVLGVMLGQVVRTGADSDYVSRGGQLVAGGNVARALDTQLAAAQSAGAPVRMLVSFRNAEGDYCRAFESPVQGGIACRKDGGWQIRQLRSAKRAESGEYRQAGSEAAALMADAQAMMAGEPLDAASERAAQAKGWVRD